MDELKPWRTVESRTVLTVEPWLEVAVDTVELPDGRRVDKFVQLRQPDFVCIWAETAEGRVIALRQFRYGPRRVCLTFPGGHIDRPGEMAVETAKRELMEETGYEAEAWIALGSYITFANARGPVCHMFRATGCRQVAEADSGDLEETRIELRTRAEVLEAVRDGHVPILNQIALVAMVTSSEVTAAVGRTG